MNDAPDLQSEASVGRDSPNLDADAIRAHFTMLHESASRVGMDGVLVLASFGEDPGTGEALKPRIRNFRIGDVDDMVATAKRWASERHRNVYAPLALFRSDLPNGQKGSEKDIVAVLGLVADFDDNRARHYRDRLPLNPDFVLETSTGRFQAGYVLDKPLPREDVKPFAQALQALARCDHGTKDLSHVWRIPGTLNWPNQRKVNDGRPREPQVVRLVEEWGEFFTPADDLLKEFVNSVHFQPRPKPLESGNKFCSAKLDLPDEPPKPLSAGRIARLCKTYPDFGATWEHTREDIKDQSASGYELALAKLAYHYGLSATEAWALLRAYREQYPGSDANKWQRRDYITWTLSKAGYGDQAHNNSRSDRPLLNPADPLPSARLFIEQDYTRDALRTLHHHSGAFYSWGGTAYAELKDEDLRTQLYHYLEGAERPIGKGNRAPFWPNLAKVNHVLDALKAAANLPHSNTPPCWLGDQSVRVPAHEITACANGLLHLPTRKLLVATPAFFGLNALPFDYDPQAQKPENWRAFLKDLWPNDSESIATLQEIFGYFLTPDTSQQKLFMLVGPKRSGKGTIGRVLRALLGAANVCAPMLSSLGTNFGLEPLIGKQLAIMSDARLGRRVDQTSITERLLSISGEDALTIDRKYQSAWTGRLTTRFLILTNELPHLSDASGALASRFVLLTLKKSFYGHEDPGLTGRLIGELPSILNWAIEGQQRLQHRGHFMQPKSARQALDELEALSSPISAFVNERCIIDGRATVDVARLFEAWRYWCDEQNRPPGDRQTFGRNLRAEVPGIRISQPRDGADRRRVYHGIGLKQ